MKKLPTSSKPISILEDNRAAVDTETAAHYLNRKSQTLRLWACKGEGPLKPLRIYGRLAWPMKDIKRLLGV